VNFFVNIKVTGRGSRLKDQALAGKKTMGLGPGHQGELRGKICCAICKL